MYIFYNPNPRGKKKEDCVVRAISLIENKSWDQIYLGVVLQGFFDADMPSVNTVWGNYLRRHGYRRYVIPNTCPDCYTVRDFCAEHPRGEYILATGSHVVAVVDGDYYDAWDSGNEVPIYYWQKERG